MRHTGLLLAGMVMLIGWGTATRVDASCGDYLMLQDHDEGVETVSALLADFRPALPCHGPGCGQAPEGGMSLVAPPERHRQVQVDIDRTTMEPTLALPPSITLWPQSDATVSNETSGPFRPPQP